MTVEKIFSGSVNEEFINNNNNRISIALYGRNFRGAGGSYRRTPTSNVAQCNSIKFGVRRLGVWGQPPFPSQPAFMNVVLKYEHRDITKIPTISIDPDDTIYRYRYMTRTKYRPITTVKLL